MALVKEFNASHPGLKVVLSQTSPNQDTSKLATAIRAHAVPDVVGLNDIDVPQFSRLGALTDITQYVNALPYKKDLSPGHLALAGYNGKYYGVPYLGDLSVLWYNKKLFKQAGLDPNKPPANFAADPRRREEDPGARQRDQRLRDGGQLPGLPRLRDGAAPVRGQRPADPRADRPPDDRDREQRAAQAAAHALPAALVAEARLARQPDRVGPDLGQRLRGGQGRHPAGRVRLLSAIVEGRDHQGRRHRAAARADRQVLDLRRRRRLRHPGRREERRRARGSSSSGSSRRPSRCSTRRSATRRSAPTS